MINRKRLLSVAAAVAISSSMVIADYLPLTSTTVEDKWVMFGVAGFHANGATTGAAAGGAVDAGTFTISDDEDNVATDTGGDELYGEEGTNPLTIANAITSGGNILGSVKKIDAGDIEVRVDVANISYFESDPVRTIYVKENADDENILFAFSYKSALEGEKLEFSTTASTATDDAYRIIINSENTYSNPAIAEYIPAIEATGGTEGDLGNYLTSINDVVDYNLTGGPQAPNPLNVAKYLRVDHQDTAGSNESLRLYSYNPNGIWEMYDSRNTFQDFEALQKGKGYWGKMDLNNTARPAGLVLGSPSISTQDYIDSGIAEGWNLLAFNAKNADLRAATTGLIVTVGTPGTITLTDVSGNHETANIDVNASNITASARLINQTIKTEKITGTIPKTMNIVAIPASTTQIALLSDEKFILKEDTAGTLTVVTTLAGQVANDAVTLTEDTDNNQDITDGLMSLYGEYALIVKPENETYAVLEIKCMDGSTNVSQKDINSTVTAIGGATCIENATLIDSNFDGNVSAANGDLILMASDKPFEIRDHTFSRVFQYTDRNVSGTLKFVNSDNDVQVTIAADANITAADTNITAAAESTIVDTNNIIISMKNEGSNEFQVLEIGAADNLTPTTTTSAVAKGAISDVFSPNSIVKAAIQNKVVATITDTNASTGIAAGTTFILEVETIQHDANITFDPYTVELADINNSTVVYSKLTTHINDQFNKEYIDSRISITDINGDNDFNATANIVGSDITSAALTISDGNVSAATVATLGIPIIDNGDITQDLKFNYVLSPNYVLDGPLYEMVAAGFQPLAMVTGTMNNAGNAMGWDGIDLTRKPSEWLESQDYNLFTVDSQAGYWTYLEVAEPNPLGFTAAPFSGNYTQHFDQNGKTFNQVAGGLEIIVSGVSEADDRKSARVIAIVGGSEIELSREGLSEVYSAQISSHELKEMRAGREYDIQVMIADGLGHRIPATSTDVTVDFKAPEKPALAFDAGTVAITNDEADGVTQYYVYIGNIPAEGAEAAKDITISAEDAAAYNLCGGSTEFNRENSYNLKIVALDGEDLSSSNVSDAFHIDNYSPIFKNSAIITNTRDGDTSNSLADIRYNSSCVVDETPFDQSIQASSRSNLKTIKVAYEPKPVGTGTPITVFVDGGSQTTTTASITYNEDYIGDIVYVQLDGRVYKYKLPEAADAVLTTEESPIDLSTDPDGTELPGQSI